MANVEAISRANDMRKRILAGETIDKEELAEVYAALRSDRASAMSQSSSKKKEKKPSSLPTDLGSLFS
jgi:hypothetical protein